MTPFPSPKQGMPIPPPAKARGLPGPGSVIQVMQNLDNMLLSSDGLKWFNLLYLHVTQAVYEKPPAAGWHDQEWLFQLDITSE